MKNVKKALLVVLCVILLVVSSVLGTLAYLTDNESVVNTFTVGQIHILLDEEDTDNDDNKTDITPDSNPKRDKANEYHLIPGSTYEKDPTVWVAADSEDAWVFVTVANGISDIEADTEDTANGYKKIVDQMTANGWLALTKNGAQVAYNGLPVYYYKDIVAKNASAEQKKLVVFSEFKIDGNKAVNVTENNTLTPEEIAAGKRDIANYTSANITVTAYAIQSAGFETNVIGAWEALNGSLPTT